MTKINFCHLLNDKGQRWPVLSLEDFEPRQGQAFWRAKLLRPGGTSSDAVLVVGVRAREPPHFFSLNSEKMGIPRLPLIHTCLILPFGRSCGTARKTASPAGEAQRASNKREKN